ncbi:cysteine-rich receptor-like protein kinase 28 [Diospyros lotus]|uniref:cysteine-rich receptor-like protein kinase 28 n=1 Tax=Diospyros lotus TaxID=55363 RepID=UPI0022590660|nr:cysteine-rich receptor-like protein kinase 28 [Diospyros lotus]
MNAKISDFGMARLFAAEISKGNTKRIAGTLGYMPPEYTQYGQFSFKTDVLVSECAEHLISYAWKKWKEGKASMLIDGTIRGGSEADMLRCIHIGLLCLQENAARRPTMASVVLMLNSFSTNLPTPARPTFLMKAGHWHLHDQSQLSSINEVSISQPGPR